MGLLCFLLDDFIARRSMASVFIYAVWEILYNSCLLLRLLYLSLAESHDLLRLLVFTQDYQSENRKRKFWIYNRKKMLSNQTSCPIFSVWAIISVSNVVKCTFQTLFETHCPIFHLIQQTKIPTYWEDQNILISI